MCTSPCPADDATRGSSRNLDMWTEDKPMPRAELLQRIRGADGVCRHMSSYHHTESACSASVSAHGQGGRRAARRSRSHFTSYVHTALKVRRPPAQVRQHHVCGLRPRGHGPAARTWHSPGQHPGRPHQRHGHVARLHHITSHLIAMQAELTLALLLATARRLTEASAAVKKYEHAALLIRIMLTRAAGSGASGRRPGC